MSDSYNPAFPGGGLSLVTLVRTYVWFTHHTMVCDYVRTAHSYFSLQRCHLTDQVEEVMGCAACQFVNQVPKMYNLEPADPQIMVGKDNWNIIPNSWKKLGCSKLDLMCVVAFAQSPNSDNGCMLSSVCWGVVDLWNLTVQHSRSLLECMFCKFTGRTIPNSSFCILGWLGEELELNGPPGFTTPMFSLQFILLSFCGLFFVLMYFNS